MRSGVRRGITGRYKITWNRSVSPNTNSVEKDLGQCGLLRGPKGVRRSNLSQQGVFEVQFSRIGEIVRQDHLLEGGMPSCG